MSKAKEKNKNKYRVDLMILAAIFVLIVGFCAYLMNTSVTDVLSKERGESVISHDYTFDDSVDDTMSVIEQ